MRLSPTDRLSLLACVTGLALLAIAFASAAMGARNPEWLTMVIAAIAGFEVFMALDATRRRRAGDGSNG